MQHVKLFMYKHAHVNSTNPAHYSASVGEVLSEIGEVVAVESVVHTNTHTHTERHTRTRVCTHAHTQIHTYAHAHTHRFTQAKTKAERHVRQPSPGVCVHGSGQPGPEVPREG